jgi:lactate 2-monooxygenase
VTVIGGISSTGNAPRHLLAPVDFLNDSILAYRPRTDEITLSLLERAKANGFTALVVTLDTMLLGWRPLDIQSTYLPFLQGVGIQVGVSDPVFMKRFGLQPVHGKDAHPKFPYDPKEVEAKLAQGDEETKKRVMLGKAWLGECNSGMFRTWEDVRFLRENWEGPLILKGIQNVAVWCILCFGISYPLSIIFFG